MGEKGELDTIQSASCRASTLFSKTKQGVKQGIQFTYLGRFLPPANEGMGS